MKDEAYRRKFRKEYERKGTARVWQRNFHDAFIVECPDATLVGKSFGDVADARGIHPVDAFLDLVVEHGRSLRWRTTIANDRPAEMARLIAEKSALIGFADSGAHIRNMAFYSFPLRMLRYVRDTKTMPIETAIWRLTGELADWMGIDAGRLAVGSRADVTVIDPTALDARLDEYHEATMEGFGDLRRMVNRSDGAVSSVLINGRVAFDGTAFAGDLGKATGYGTFLPARGTPPAMPRHEVERAA
jgi:N-acyl-D-aspartate/D-glutamate deacylase